MRGKVEEAKEKAGNTMTMTNMTSDYSSGAAITMTMIKESRGCSVLCPPISNLER